MRARRVPRGFSLVELATVLGIVAILSGITVAALTRLKSRGNFSSATGDYLSTLRTARAEAFARTNPVVVITDMANGRWWAVEDVNGDFAIGSFDPATPAPAPDRLIYAGNLPAGVSFGPAKGWGRALSPPLSGIPTGFVNIVLADGGSGGTADITTDGGSSSPNFNYCSFCDSSTKMGAIIFMPAGGAIFQPAGPTTIGQQIAMQDIPFAPDGGLTTASGIVDFAIVQTTGSIEAVTIK